VTGDQEIAVVGLGYVGLPLALAFVEAGCRVVGVDADDARVAELSSGRSPIDDITDERLRSALASGLSITHTERADLATPDVVFVCVPTPINEAKDPDLGPVLSAAARIRRELRAGQLVVLESTTYPGTTTGPFRGSSGAAGSSPARLRPRLRPERVNRRSPRPCTVPRLVGLAPRPPRPRPAPCCGISDDVRELTSPMPPSSPSSSRTSSGT
jgi:UDP-N-acetyl-D-glucosamine dehydrogenase